MAAAIAAGTAAAPASDPESDCVMAYTGPDLGPVFSLEVLSDMFLYGSHNGMIRGFYLEDPYTACELANHKGAITGLVADGEETLFSCSADGTVRTWDVIGREEVTCRELSTEGVGCLSHVNKWVVAGTGDGYVHAWHAKAPAGEDPTHSLRVHTGSVTAVQPYFPMATQLQCFTVSNDGLAKFVDVTTGQLAAVYEGCGPLQCCVHDEQNNVFYVGGSKKHVLIYDVRSAGCVGQLRGHTEAVIGMVRPPPETWGEPAAVPDLADIQAAAGTAPGTAAAPQDIPPPIPAEQVLYTASDDKTIMLWNVKTMTPEYVFRGHATAVSCIKYTSSNQLFTGSYDSSVRVWDVEGAFRNIAIKSLQNAERRERARKEAAREKREKKESKKGSKKKGDKKKSKKKKK